MTTFPDFRNPQTLLSHVRQTMAFYHPRAIDPTGGCYHYFLDDGTIYDAHTRHLVSSTRMVFNYAMAYRQFKEPAYLAGARQAVAFVRDVHRNPETGGYAWVLDWRNGEKTVKDGTNHCYGLAFVVLAYAQAILAGLTEAKAWLEETYDLMERRFWDAQAGLYADEAAADWSELSAYRGQNANMHTCEAMLTAFEATGDVKYLHRAEQLARHITVRQASLANDLVWEHYRPDWSVDWDYNRDDKTNIFRPWGYQPGHLTEWAKLLLIMRRHAGLLQGPADWLLPKAQALFDAAVQSAWDHEHGGLYYGFAPDGSICDEDKYFWVQAESLAAAALLADATADERYWQWYQRLWEYSWAHLIDHQHGAWYRILRRDNTAYSNEKSPAGKTDYHTMGACYEVLSVLPATQVA
ncbi:mannose/cellobiose epimerase-like protein (N-acyl-D-glucosamine 2-epimerase family) [Chitinivorax tropicus]|uniref:Mannose/cellobiose epimerase-like protein (N-acyl-D-glucosamine 2-epimerase family) n=1 Tax=Chitinivorax tropicus TaxID=714531 RepID=A0A840MRC9_9PROT|nr:AGE family epimerase/isomerase [Chitinivorax tropicus]MBB5018996.1 mannose/cellobiose epimerase-like protein (N-acyl-D-glucosamine 2-epimerase family) [Chitinivorax tropicus]